MAPTNARRPGQAAGAQGRDRGWQGQAAVTAEDIWPREWEALAAQGRREGSPARKAGARAKQPLPKLTAMLARADKGEPAAGQALGAGKGRGAGGELRVGAGRDAHGSSWWCAFAFSGMSVACLQLH